MHIEDVKIIEGLSIYNLESKIISLMGIGYELSGDMIVAYSQVGESPTFYQRMIKIKSELIQE